MRNSSDSDDEKRKKNSKLSILKEKLKNSQKENQKLEEDLEKSNTLAAKYKKKYESILERNEDLEKELSKPKMIKEEKKIENPIKKFKTSEKTKYDIVVNIDSLLTASITGWQVEYRNKEMVEKCYGKSQIALGMIGRENVGKTYIINMISGGNFPSGYYNSTKGLSVKYCDEEKDQLKVLLDSAGMNGAIYFYNKSEIEKYLRDLTEKKIHKKDFERIKEKMINDRSMTEYFIQNFILYACNIIVIVVELLTQHDQKIIERIKHLYHERKTIIIIHNLFKLELKEHVIRRSAFEIEGSFSVVKQIIPGSNQVPFYIEKLKDKQMKNIVHFVLGKESSESGNFFNEPSLNHIKKTIETETDIEKFNLLERLNKFWVEKNRIYFNNFVNSKEIPIFEEKKKSPNEYFYQLNFSENLELKVPEFNVLGAMKELDITYHVYEISNPKREKIYFFELPGCKEKPEITLKKTNRENEQILTLMIKSYINYPKNYKCNVGGLNSGIFSKKIKINDEFGEYNCDRDYTQIENGILQMKFNLIEEEEL